VYLLPSDTFRRFATGLGVLNHIGWFNPSRNVLPRSLRALPLDRQTVQLSFDGNTLVERQTGQNMFDVLVRSMDAVIPSWRRRCIAVSKDGVRSMTGRSQSIPPSRGIILRPSKKCAAKTDGHGRWEYIMCSI
jgi:hypothetical protein